MEVGDGLRVVGLLEQADPDGGVRLRVGDGRLAHVWPALAIEPRYRPAANR